MSNQRVNSSDNQHPIVNSLTLDEASSILSSLSEDLKRLWGIEQRMFALLQQNEVYEKNHEKLLQTVIDLQEKLAAEGSKKHDLPDTETGALATRAKRRRKEEGSPDVIHSPEENPQLEARLKEQKEKFDFYHAVQIETIGRQSKLLEKQTEMLQEQGAYVVQQAKVIEAQKKRIEKLESLIIKPLTLKNVPAQAAEAAEAPTLPPLDLPPLGWGLDDLNSISSDEKEVDKILSDFLKPTNGPKP